MAATGARLRTPLCDLLGIDHPILQSGMGGVAGPELAAEVSGAGGLGILAGTLTAAPALRDAIAALQGATARPFGVNLLLLPELRTPTSTDLLTDDELAAVHAALAPMRATLGLPDQRRRPRTAPDLVAEALDVILDAGVPVLSIGLGDPGPELVERCHRNGTKVIAMVTTAADARTVEASGVDAVVAQGAEAGGHRSHFTKPDRTDQADVGTMALVPEVVDAVRIPVIAAGGIIDGRGLVAALALGAHGVLMGSRFVATRESTAPEVHKKRLLEEAGTATVVTDTFSGRFARVLRNRFTEDYASSGAPVLPFPSQLLANADVRAAATDQDDAEHLPLWSGQAVGHIDDLPWAREVITDTIAQAHALITHGLARATGLTDR